MPLEWVATSQAAQNHTLSGRWVRCMTVPAVTDVAGPVNLVGPAPVTNAEFTRVLNRVVHRPTFPIPVPGFALRALLGQFADEGVLIGQRLAPAALERSDLIVATRNGEAVRLKDVATVEDSYQSVKTSASYNGERSIALLVQRQPNANTVQVVDAVRALLPRWWQVEKISA